MTRVLSRRLAALALGLVAACRPASPTAPSEATPAPNADAPAETSPADATPEAQPESSWRDVASEEGIVVTSHPSEHSSLPMFRGVGVVEAPLLEVLAVVTDADRHHEWVHNCSDSALVAQTSDSTGVVYNRTATPWPVPDRDVVLDSRIEVIDGDSEAVVRFTATEHSERTPQDGVVRMPYLQGHYHLWAEDAERTRVEYQVDGDPGGRLPTWLATRGTRDMPLETLRNLRTQVVRTRGAYDERIAEFRRTLLAP